MSFRVFLTHSEPDYGLALHVAGELRANGFHPIIAKDIRNPIGLTSLPRKVQGLIRTCHLQVAIVTKNSIDSPFVNQEIGFGIGKVPLLPLVEDGLDPLRLAFLQGAEFVKLRLDDVAEASRQTLDWAAKLRLRRKKNRDMVLAAIIIVAAALILWFVAKTRTRITPGPRVLPGVARGGGARALPA